MDFYKMLLKSILMLFLLLLVCCQNISPDKEDISEEMEFLQNVLEANGGMDRWNKIISYSFIKKTRLFLSDRSLENEILQKQTFSIYPHFYAEIEYLNDSLERKIIQENDHVFYFEKGTLIEHSVKHEIAKKSIRTAFYVIGLPFKLKDEGVIIGPIENITIEGGLTVKSIAVNHKENGDIKEEDWWIYFDANNLILEGYKIRHDGRYSYILQDSMTVVNGFHVPVIRRSIAMDHQQQNAYLRADYVFSDIKIELAKDVE